MVGLCAVRGRVVRLPCGQLRLRRTHRSVSYLSLALTLARARALTLALALALTLALTLTLTLTLPQPYPIPNQVAWASLRSSPARPTLPRRASCCSAYPNPNPNPNP